MYIEITATFFGAIQSVLVLLNRRSNWIFYMLQMLFMLWFSYENNLYGDCVNDIIYFMLGILGFSTWKHKTRTITKCEIGERALYSVLIVIATAVTYFLLKRSNDPLPLIDSITTITSFAATVYMVRRKVDAWILWFVNDAFYCIEYILLPQKALFLLGLNVFYLCMAIMTFIVWNRESKRIINNN